MAIKKPCASARPEGSSRSHVPDIWTWLTVSTAPIVVFELYVLRRYQRALRSDLHVPHPQAAATAAAEAILCLDPEGRCTGANLAARRLLQPLAEEITLNACLPGGTQEASRMLAVVAQDGIIECDIVLCAQPSPALFHIQAIALRDRDNNFWGAVLFIRPPAITRPGAASEPVPH